MNRSSFLTGAAFVFGLLPLLGAPLTAFAQTSGDEALQAWAAHAQHMTPTVTAEMGDVGGKSFGRVPDPAKTRHYYISAEVDAWDFAPGKIEPVCGKTLPPALVQSHVAVKVRYFQYTDATFTARVLPTARLGILGPVLRGVVGEDLVVTFLNRTQFPLSMHPHGVKYDKDSEGAHDGPGAGLGSAVGSGARFTYVWHLDEAAGPLPGEPSSKCWLYHSHVSGDEEANLGLIGCIIVTDPARARPDGTPNDVDREMASLFMIFNESGYDEEAAEMAAADGDEAAGPAKTWAQGEEEREQASRYAINGYVFGTHPGLEVNEGERVRWYLLCLGDEHDVHTAHWHGLRVIEENRRRTDVIELLPASMKVADMMADNPGTWLYHCHVAEHMREGMFSRLTVHARGTGALSRDRASAFLGLPGAAQSLRVTSAALTGGVRPALVLRGQVTVPDALPIATTPLCLALGAATAALQPGPDGVAEQPGLTFRVLDSQHGQVYGAALEWEAVLTGPDWLAEWRKAGPEGSIPFRLSVGEVSHVAQVHGP